MSATDPHRILRAPVPDPNELTAYPYNTLQRFIATPYGGLYMTPQDVVSAAYARVLALDQSAVRSSEFGALLTYSALKALNESFVYDDLAVRLCNVDNQPGNVRGLVTLSRLQAYDGVNWDLMRSGNAAGRALLNSASTQMMCEPGEWSIFSAPSADAQAIATRANGGTGVRHVLRSVSATLIADPAGVAPIGPFDLVVRDGNPGVGAIIWRDRVSASPGNDGRITLSGLNLVGTANVAMTVEFTAAPGALNFETLAATGHSAGA